MKNLMKQKIKMAMENWPRRKPCVKESDDEPPGAGRGTTVGACSTMFATCISLPAEQFHI